MLQIQTKLKSLHANIKEPKHKVALATSKLEFFYFVDVAATLNEVLDDELKLN